jgi:uncharacterized protein YndB with AHSA1/START domain
VPASILVAIRVPTTPERAFRVFTGEVGRWWRPNRLFQFVIDKQGVLAFEPGPSGRLVEAYEDGSSFEIGRITDWQPPGLLAFTWRQATFSGDQQTHVRVRFEAVENGTRVTVEHIGWDSVPQEHAARHGFPLGVFQQRHAEWWQALLGSYQKRLANA